MEIHIGNYLDSNNYTNWSTSGLLQYLVEKENYTTEDATNIHNAFCRHLEKKSTDHNMFKYARNKAERLARTLDLAEVTQFFNLSSQIQEQDQRAQIQEYQWAQRQHDQRIQSQCQFIQTLIHDYSTLYEQKQRCNLKIRVADTLVEYEISTPDVSPQCFKTLLNYMYSGNICLENYEKSEIFDLYFVAMKFNLKEIVNYLKEIIKFTF
ncbi:BTB/POZ protein [Rhizophagus clarus]|uniref:BTB/POZ protein n=1 Tax=Rhizophagus clarus TaxID=94130 RepID=A0A8H3R6L8_9GLOM|nr:BTB/POZ protein [Rhizophagus clarus]